MDQLNRQKHDSKKYGYRKKWTKCANTKMPVTYMYNNHIAHYAFSDNATK